jgi:DNA-binding NarL/FixJ family response regulator
VASINANYELKSRTLRSIPARTVDRGTGGVPEQTAVFIVDPHSIFRLGMATCLESLALVGRVTGSDTVEEAWERPELAQADLVIIDADVPGIRAFIQELRTSYETQCLASGSSWDADTIAAVVEAGAMGVLAKESLTPATLEANVRATLHGAGVLPSELMASVLSAPEGGGVPAGEAGPLNEREQQVLRLIADGHGTREVAAELSYSERTIKNVLHDVVTKLGARSRSHAVAHAVRAGLI